MVVLRNCELRSFPNKRRFGGGTRGTTVTDK